MHLADARVLAPPDSINRALGAVKEVVCELNYDQASAQVGQLFDRMFLPQERTLDSLLPATSAADLRRIVEQAQLDWSKIRRLMPWAILMSIASCVPASGHERPALVASIDPYMFAKAKSLGLEVGGLEEIDEQLAGVQALSLDQQLQLLQREIDTRTGKRKGTSPEAMKDAFFRGDAEALLHYRRSLAAAEKTMLVERNDRMLQRIIERLRHGRAGLFVVGALHLLGPDGLVAKLKLAGFEIARVE
jgi:uncharacterized protein YbaP (TraB family)